MYLRTPPLLQPADTIGAKLARFVDRNPVSCRIAGVAIAALAFLRSSIYVMAYLKAPITTLVSFVSPEILVLVVIISAIYIDKLACDE
jgi:hypothetical protein